MGQKEWRKEEEAKKLMLEIRNVSASRVETDLYLHNQYEPSYDFNRNQLLSRPYTITETYDGKFVAHCDRINDEIYS